MNYTTLQRFIIGLFSNNTIGHTVELQWLEHPWNHEKMVEAEVERIMSANHSARTRDITGIFFGVCITCCCVFSLQSHHRGNFNEYIQHTIIKIKKKITRNYPKYNVCSYGIFC